MNFDTTLGLSEQATAVMAMLSKREPDFVPYKDSEYIIEINSSAWYNGRERGICLVVRRMLSDKTCLIVTFGECRGSDGIFVDAWDMTDKAYQERKEFGYGRTDLAVRHILNVMETFYVAQTPKAEVGT